MRAMLLASLLAISLAGAALGQQDMETEPDTGVGDPTMDDPLTGQDAQEQPEEAVGPAMDMTWILVGLVVLAIIIGLIWWAATRRRTGEAGTTERRRI